MFPTLKPFTLPVARLVELGNAMVDGKARGELSGAVSRRDRRNICPRSLKQRSPLIASPESIELASPPYTELDTVE